MYKSAVLCVSVGIWVVTLDAVVGILSGFVNVTILSYTHQKDPLESITTVGPVLIAII